MFLFFATFFILKSKEAFNLSSVFRQSVFRYEKKLTVFGIKVLNKLVLSGPRLWRVAAFKLAFIADRQQLFLRLVAFFVVFLPATYEHPVFLFCSSANILVLSFWTEFSEKSRVVKKK